LKFPKFDLASAWPQWKQRYLSREGLTALKASLQAAIARLRAQLAEVRAKSGQSSTLTIRPERLSAWICFVLMLLIAFCATYWVMRLARTVFPPQVSSKGVVFYEAASSQRVRTLFGEKDFDPSRLVLRGVVITGAEAGVNQGVALIEADGKPAETLAIGEMMSPGIRLEKISPESVVVRYQGRAYELQQSTAN
jgi:hypothetical protein